MSSLFTSFCLAFTPSQIHQVQLALPNPLIRSHHFNIYGENRVRPGAVGVHQCSSHSSIPPTFLHQCFAFLDIMNSMLTYLRNVDPFLRVLLQIQFLSTIFSQQVSDFFIVNLQVWGMNQVLDIIWWFNRLEDMLESTGNHSFVWERIWNALHSKGLSTARLAISEYCSIVPFKDTLKQISN